MECRCYHGGDGRTKMKLLRFKQLDLRGFLTGVMLLAAVFTLINFGL
jgi:energy-coupling factor transport system permease protein